MFSIVKRLLLTSSDVIRNKSKVIKLRKSIIFFFILSDYYKKQLTYKPGSVNNINYCACHLSWHYVTIMLQRPTLRHGRVTLNAGLLGLTTPQVHSSCITTGLVSSYLTFSPLPFGGYFLLHFLTLTDNFLLRRGTLCVAQTFLYK